jgi:hypothetical protein
MIFILINDKAHIIGSFGAVKHTAINYEHYLRMKNPSDLLVLKLM